MEGEARGSRYNAGKWIPTFWPREALEAAARVWEFGARKYARDDWKGGMPHTEIADCALRHLHAWLDGEDLDEESGLHHVWHALCNLAMLAWMLARRPDLDDRVRRASEFTVPEDRAVRAGTTLVQTEHGKMEPNEHGAFRAKVDLRPGERVVVDADRWVWPKDRRV